MKPKCIKCGTENYIGQGESDCKYYCENCDYWFIAIEI